MSYSGYCTSTGLLLNSKYGPVRQKRQSKLVKSRSGRCLDRSEHRSFTVQVTVSTTVTLSQMPNVENPSCLRNHRTAWDPGYLRLAGQVGRWLRVPCRCSAVRTHCMHTAYKTEHLRRFYCQVLSAWEAHATIFAILVGLSWLAECCWPFGWCWPCRQG